MILLQEAAGGGMITIDLDAFDPSILPSTGTPEPGGLLWYETLEFLKKEFRNLLKNYDWLQYKNQYVATFSSQSRV